MGAIFLLPWTMAVKRHKGPLWAGASFTIGITVLAYCPADSHKVALAIGLLAALAVFIGDRPVLKGFSFLLISGVLAAPWTVSVLPDPLQPKNTMALLPNSSQHRLVIWQTTAAHIFERPVFGSGFNTARAFYGEDQRVMNYFSGKKSRGPNLIPSTWVSYFEPIPLHPHNGVLQVWLELGAAGALLLAAGLFLIVRRLGGVENRFERAMVFGSFITGLVVFCVSYGAWQSWWMGTIWLMMVYGAAFCQDKSQ
jgi:O-antigen ligase